MTGGGTATAVSVLKGLRAQRRLPVKVVLADCADDFAGRHLADGHALIPRVEAPELVDAIFDLASSLDAKLIVPVFDLELPKLAAERERFERAGMHLAVGPPAAVEICRDKLALARLAERLGLAVAPIWSAEAALEAGAESFPLFGRPRDGRGSIDACPIPSPAALKDYLERVPDPILQDFVDGPEVTVDVIADRGGRFLAACPRWRQMVKAGQSYKGLTFHDPELQTACRLLVEELGLAGPSCIQCFRLRDRILFTEVNPRFGAATILTIDAGMNGPLYLLEEALGMTPTPLVPRAGVRMLRYWQEVTLDADGGALVPGRLR